MVYLVIVFIAVEIARGRNFGLIADKCNTDRKNR